MSVRAVLFDAGETLVHPAPSFPELFVRVLADEGHERTAEDVREASTAVFHRFSEAARDRELWTTSPERSAAFWRGVYERMLESLSLPAQDGLRDTLYATFTDLGNYALFDDVVPALDALPPSLTLGIVSNFEAWLEELLGALGVRERFPVRAISGIEGVEKPEPEIFLRALARAGVEPGEAVYVGDNPEFDVVPAAALGMTPVLIDRRERFPDHDGLRIGDLRDLPAVVGAL
ncbi:MAG TPA: HAD-IA family hydrolase [Actinomycetota bacterium]